MFSCYSLVQPDVILDAQQPVHIMVLNEVGHQGVVGGQLGLDLRKPAAASSRVRMHITGVWFHTVAIVCQIMM